MNESCPHDNIDFEWVVEVKPDGTKWKRTVRRCADCKKDV